jgi:hypothetical protein
MKLFIVFAFLFVVLATPVFAKDRDARTIHFSQLMRAGTIDLPAGEYQMTWIGTGPEVQVSFTQRKHAVTVPAKVIEIDNSRTVSQTDEGFIVDSKLDDDKTLLLDMRFPHLSLFFSPDLTAAR